MKIIKIEMDLPDDFVPPETVDDARNTGCGRRKCDPCPLFQWNDYGGFGWCAMLGEYPKVEPCPIRKHFFDQDPPTGLRRRHLLHNNSERKNLAEIKTVKLKWDELSTLFETIFKEILSKTIKCKADFDSYDYWGVRFVDYEMSVDEIETVCSYVHANEKERKDAFPVEGASVSRDFGVGISSKLLSSHLGYTWKKEFADEDALYLIECANIGDNEQSSGSQMKGNSQ